MRLGFPPDFSFGEKKRLLGEIIHKIKVDSKNEVHLFMKRPVQISLGLTVQYGSPYMTRFDTLKLNSG